MRMSTRIVIGIYILVGIMNTIIGFYTKDSKSLIIGAQFFLLAFTVWSYESIIAIKEENLMKELVERLSKEEVDK